MTAWTDILAVHVAETQLTRAMCFEGCAGDDTPQQLDYYFWILRRGAEVIVVDTSFNAAIAARRGRVAALTPAAALDALGIDPAAVREVVMTHLHYDHAGNSDLYPNARFWLQQAELDFVTGPDMADHTQSEHYEDEDIARFMALRAAGRLHLIDGTAEVAPGVTLHPVPGHTPGVQVVRVEGAAGPVVLGSDAIHYYASDPSGLVFPVVRDPDQERAGYALMRRLADGSERIVAGHDPETRRRWPATRGHPRIHDVSPDPLVPMADCYPIAELPVG